MSVLLTIRDEEMTGKMLNEFSLEVESEKITVRELIRSRVFQEVKDHNVKQNQVEFNGLIQPTDTEQALNGPRSKKSRQINWQRQFEKAVEAYEKNQILILVDDRQTESLDQEIEITSKSTIAFLKLTILVGG